MSRVLALAALLAVGVVVSVEAQTAGDELQFLQPAEIVSLMSSLWPCPEMDDEFEQQRCASSRRARRDRVRTGLFGAVTGATVGRYDFERHRFPVDIAGAVLAPPDAEWLAHRAGPQLEPWNASGLMVLAPTAYRASSGSIELPREWRSATQASISFPSDAEAEAWKERLGDAKLGALLMFRVAGTWRTQVPASQMPRSLRRLFGLSASPPTSFQGVEIRPVGYVVFDIDVTCVVAEGVLPSVRRRDRIAVQAALATLAERRARREASATVGLPAHDTDRVTGSDSATPPAPTSPIMEASE